MLYGMRVGLPFVFALSCALGAVGQAVEKPLCQVVWKPAPVDAAEHPAANADDLAAATAALARGAPLVAVVEALGSGEVHRLLLALTKPFEGDVAVLGEVLRATYVGVERETARRGPAPGKEQEALLEPDETAWAFWNAPEGYLHGYFAHHWLHNGYSAVGVGGMRVWYTPAPAVAPVNAAVASSITAAAGGTTATVVAPIAAAPSSGGFAAGPAAAFVASLPVGGNRFAMAAAPLPLETYESTRIIPEPASTALSLLALAVLLVRRRRPVS